jgi:DEAD/DEAH box helicase domain-containing protein
MKYSCPKCKSGLEIQKTFNQKFMISCEKCQIQDLLKFTKNIDEAYLDFLTKFDEGMILDRKQMSMDFKTEGIIRDEKEINKMIGNNSLDELTKSVLYSKKDYISKFKTLKNPLPKLGSKIDELGLDDEISSYLKKIGIQRFYKFQEDAIKEIIYGNNVVIEAPTASGKTEAFLIPILQKIKDKRNNQDQVLALFVYPTKALARDQYPKILEFAKRVGITVSVFDGDTKQSERVEILDNPPNLIITNFDVLHYHLWHRTRFASLLYSVKFLITDEVHVYSGIFGSNVHYIIKRLKRICNKIQFIASSATLENAIEFCECMFGEKMSLIRGYGRKGETDSFS